MAGNIIKKQSIESEDKFLKGRNEKVVEQKFDLLLLQPKELGRHTKVKPSRLNTHHILNS